MGRARCCVCDKAIFNSRWDASLQAAALRKMRHNPEQHYEQAEAYVCPVGEWHVGRRPRKLDMVKLTRRERRALGLKKRHRGLYRWEEIEKARVRTNGGSDR